MTYKTHRITLTGHLALALFYKATCKGVEHKRGKLVVQCSAQGHFDMWWDWGLGMGGQPAQPPEL